MVVKTVLTGPNTSAVPFVTSMSTAVSAPTRVSPTRFLSLTSGGQRGLWCNQNADTHSLDFLDWERS